MKLVFFDILKAVYSKIELYRGETSAYNKLSSSMIVENCQFC